MIKTASRIIAKFGQAGTFERLGAEPQNPWDPPESEPTSYPATVAVVAYDQSYRDGTLIQANDLRVLVSVEGLDIVPSVSDRLSVGAAEFSIANVTPLAPDGVARFYDLQVRR
jgi:hypothetical protein